MSSHTYWSRLERSGLLVLTVCALTLFSSVAAVAVPTGPSGPQSEFATQNTQSSTTPEVELSLDGRLVKSDRTVVEDDPQLTVNASVGSGVSNGTTLEAVTIRVNGQTVRSYSPDKSAVSVSVDLPLRRGNNSLTVITEDSADHVNSRKVEVAKDDLAPWIGLTQPYSTELRSVIPNGTVDSSAVTLGFRIGEFSTVESAVITTQYDYSENNKTAPGSEPTISNRTYQLPDPGKRFTQDVVLGYGSNEVSIQVSDIVGNTREQTFTLNVTDDTAPAFSLDLYPQQTTNRAINLSGTIDDNVWVETATIEVFNVDRQEEVENVTGGTKYNYTEQIRFDPNPNDDEDRTAYRHDASGREIPFSRQLQLAKGVNEVTLEATDHLGQSVNRTLIIERLESAEQAQNEPPTVVINKDKTRRLRSGRVRLVANISDPDWNIDTVEIETENLSSGQILDYERFGNLGNRNAVTIDTTLSAIDSPVVVSARARDGSGQEDVAVQQLRPGFSQPTTPETTTPTDPMTPQSTVTTTTRPTPDPSTPTAVPTTQAPTPTTAANTTTNASASSGGGGGIIGTILGIVGGILGFIAAIMPFVIGGIVFVTTAYFALRKVREEGGESAS